MITKTESRQEDPCVGFCSCVVFPTKEKVALARQKKMLEIARMTAMTGSHCKSFNFIEVFHQAEQLIRPVSPDRLGELHTKGTFGNPLSPVFSR
jgi:hypothetical protein